MRHPFYRWCSGGWGRHRMNKTHRKGRRMAKKVVRRWRRRQGRREAA